MFGDGNNTTDEVLYRSSVSELDSELRRLEDGPLKSVTNVSKAGLTKVPHKFALMVLHEIV